MPQGVYAVGVSLAERGAAKDTVVVCEPLFFSETGGDHEYH